MEKKGGGGNRTNSKIFGFRFDGEINESIEGHGTFSYGTFISLPTLR